MRHVELVFDRDCPNTDAARANLRSAFDALGIAPRWTEHERSEAPAHLRAFGSPTIVVDGRAVLGSCGSGATCAVYEVDGRLSGAPAVRSIVLALRER